MEQNKKLEETLEATLEDERHNMLEMKSLKENYESQIKILKRNCDKEVRKLVSSRGSLYINYGDHSISFPFQTNDLEDRRSKTREEQKSETIVVNSGNYMIQFPKQVRYLLSWHSKGLPNIVFHDSIKIPKPDSQTFAMLKIQIFNHNISFQKILYPGDGSEG